MNDPTRTRLRPDYHMVIGEAMYEHKWTVQSLADETGISEESINKMLEGVYRPSPETAEKLNEALRIVLYVPEDEVEL